MNDRLETAQAREVADLLGRISFPLYATHFPLIMLLQASWGPASLTAGLVLIWAGWRLGRPLLGRIGWQR